MKLPSQDKWICKKRAWRALSLSAAQQDTTSWPAGSQRCDATAAAWGKKKEEECRAVIINICCRVRGGYHETDIAQHLDTCTGSETHIKLCENIPKQGDVGHVIYFAPVHLPPQQDFTSNRMETENRRPAQDLAIRSSQGRQSMVTCLFDIKNSGCFLPHCTLNTQQTTGLCYIYRGNWAATGGDSKLRKMGIFSEAASLNSGCLKPVSCAVAKFWKITTFFVRVLHLDL